MNIFKSKKTILLLICILSFFTRVQSQENRPNYQWPLYAYNFGGLQNLSPKDQIDTLNKYGYNGLTVLGNSKTTLTDLKPFFTYADAIENFKIVSVFFRYNYNGPEKIKNGWKIIIDQLEGKDTGLWFIFGRPSEGFTPEHIEKVLREVVGYAATKDVNVTLYPHHHDVIQTAEEAYEIINKVNAPNLDLSVHSYHEIRSGNGDRLEEILDKVKDKLGYVTIAGADTIVDYSNPWAIENSTIKPLYRGTYDVSKILNIFEGSFAFFAFDFFGEHAG